MTSPDIRALVQQAFAQALDGSIDDTTDFFAAGGDSLACEAAMNFLSTAVNHELPGWMLMDHPTQGELAQAITEVLTSPQQAP